MVSGKKRSLFGANKQSFADSHTPRGVLSVSPCTADKRWPLTVTRDTRVESTKETPTTRVYVQPSKVARSSIGQHGDVHCCGRYRRTMQHAPRRPPWRWSTFRLPQRFARGRNQRPTLLSLYCRHIHCNRKLQKMGYSGLGSTSRSRCTCESPVERRKRGGGVLLEVKAIVPQLRVFHWLSACNFQETSITDCIVDKSSRQYHITRVYTSFLGAGGTPCPTVLKSAVHSVEAKAEQSKRPTCLSFCWHCTRFQHVDKPHFVQIVVGWVDHGMPHNASACAISHHAKSIDSHLVFRP